jgi:hypothetical protein
MDEAGYWMHLEYRICREFAAMQNWDLRHYWCDGLIPDRYHLQGSPPRITGQAWVCYGQRQQEWKFTLFLPDSVGSIEEIDWASLLPAENVTRWLAFDPETQRLQIEPAAAVPDPV